MSAIELSSSLSLLIDDDVIAALLATGIPNEHDAAISVY